MILFAHKPDAVLHKMLCDIFANAVIDLRVSAHYNDEVVPYISDECLQMFMGPRTLLGVVEKLKAAYVAEEIYEVSPYYFFLIDDLLQMCIELYNDGTSFFEEDILVHPSGRKIDHIDISLLQSHLFFDLDFNLPPDTAFQIKACSNGDNFIGALPEALRAACRIPPDNADLWIRPCEEVHEEYEHEELDWFGEWVLED
ncbi:MAG: hypothetical protein GF401_00870 [Chitinivibrionales bacterium]|nr:hypothetical protein [Chitinivibrionales bacterium]